MQILTKLFEGCWLCLPNPPPGVTVEEIKKSSWAKETARGICSAAGLEAECIDALAEALAERAYETYKATGRVGPWVFGSLPTVEELDLVKGKVEAVRDEVLKLMDKITGAERRISPTFFGELSAARAGLEAVPAAIERAKAYLPHAKEDVEKAIAEICPASPHLRD